MAASLIHHPLYPFPFAPLLPAGLAPAIVSSLLSLGIKSVSVQPSVPLQHLPWDVSLEAKLPGSITSRLGFAVQKLEELGQVARAAAAAAGGEGPGGGWVGIGGWGMATHASWCSYSRVK
jgi:hypothetical protein